MYGGLGDTHYLCLHPKLILLRLNFNFTFLHNKIVVLNIKFAFLCLMHKSLGRQRKPGGDDTSIPNFSLKSRGMRVMWRNSMPVHLS